MIGTAAVGALLQNRLVSALTSQAAARSAALPPQVRAKFLAEIGNSAKSGIQVGAGPNGGVSNQAARRPARPGGAEHRPDRPRGVHVRVRGRCRKRAGLGRPTRRITPYLRASSGGPSAQWAVQPGVKPLRAGRIARRAKGRFTPMASDDLPVLELAFPGPERDSGVAAILAGEKTATARPSTAAGSWRTGSPVRATRSSYQARICGQSVSPALAASSCRAAMAAWTW